MSTREATQLQINPHLLGFTLKPLHSSPKGPAFSCHLWMTAFSLRCPLSPPLAVIFHNEIRLYHPKYTFQIHPNPFSYDPITNTDRNSILEIKMITGVYLVREIALFTASQVLYIWHYVAMPLEF